MITEPGRPKPDSYVWDGKVRELVSLLTGELSNATVVVWFNYNAEIGVACDTLLKANVPCRYLVGAHFQKTREAVRRDFQAGKFRVLLLQQAIAQMGMNLSAADTAIYFSEPTGHLARRQTEDRIVDIAKKRPLLYVHLLVKDTVDEDIYRAGQVKGLRSALSLRRALQVAMLERRRKRGP